MYHVQPLVVRHAKTFTTTTYAVIRVCHQGRRQFVTSYDTETVAHQVAGLFTRLEGVLET